MYRDHVYDYKWLEFGRNSVPCLLLKKCCRRIDFLEQYQEEVKAPIFTPSPRDTIGRSCGY